MKLNRIHLILVYIALLACVWLFIPGEVEVFLITDISLLLFTVYLLHTLYKRKFQENPSLNVGLIYILAMMTMMIFGCINYFIIQYIWPSYYFDLHRTNLYWILGLFCFGLGYILTLKPDHKIRPSSKLFLADSNLMIVVLTIFGLAGTLLILNAIGYIPILSGVSLSGLRFADEMGRYGKLWQANIVASVAAFYAIRILKTRHRKFYFFVVLFTLLQLSLFVVRFYYTLVIVAIILIYIFAREHKPLKVRKLIILFTVVVLINVLYLALREKDNAAASTAQELSFVQTNVIYLTLINYVQLGELMYHYNDFRGGTTFLNIPITFLPYQVWEIFGINKAEVRTDVSAILLADELNSETSTGLRTGIMGELYVNFAFLGAVFMVFVGWVIALLENWMRSMSESDVRVIFLFMLQSIMIYSLIGQIDVIAQAAFYLLTVMVPILMLCRKRALIQYQVANIT